MGVFANSILNENTDFAGVEDVLSTVENYQFDESASIMEACMTGILEAECDWRDMVACISAKEYSVLESTGQEMVYEAVDIRGIFNKFIELFKKIWAKIAGLFQKFLTFISGKISTDKKFLEANEKKIRAGFNSIPSGGIQMKGYTYSNLDSINYQPTNEAVFSEYNLDFSLDNLGKKDMKKEIKTYQEKRTSIEDGLRGKVLKGKGKIPAAGFAKEVKEYLRGKEFTTYKGKGDGMGIDDIINEIKTGKYSKEKCKISYNQLKNAINIAIANVKNYQNNCLKNSDDEFINLRLSISNIKVNTLRAELAIFQQVNGIQLNLMAARHAQARSIAVKLINLGVKKESASFDSENMESLFEV